VCGGHRRPSASCQGSLHMQATLILVTNPEALCWQCFLEYQLQNLWKFTQ